MSKDYVQLDNVRKALEQVVKNDEQIDEIINLLNSEVLAVEEAVPPEENDTSLSDENEEEKAPRKKQQYIIVVSDPKKLITEDLTGWITQMDEDASPVVVVDNIKKAAYNFNASKKGRKYPAQNIGDAIDGVPSKFFKHQGVKIKTKTPVLVVTTDNELPKS